MMGSSGNLAAAADHPVKAWVSVDRLDEATVMLKPFCQSSQAMVLDYYLRVEKKGQHNSSVSKQAGRVHVEPGQATGLSTTSIRLGERDKCRVQLKIMSEGRLVADEDFWLGPSGRQF